MPDFITAFRVLLAALTLLQVNGCIPGWFGPKCQFKCYCETSRDCDRNGNCIHNGKCSGYFGPGCQYLDMASFFNGAPRTHGYLTDNDDRTCNPDRGSKSLTFPLLKSLPASWFRITVKGYGEVLRFTLVINQNYPCSNEKRYVFSPSIVDVECDEAINVKELTINGEVVPYICSLQIFGGRNVALKQFVNQTSTYKLNGDASNAVDGYSYTKGLCARTNSGQNQRFTIYFDSPKKLLRGRLFNSDDYKNLHGFTIRTYNQKGQTLLTYNNKDYFKWPQDVYDMILVSKGSAVKLEIEVINNYLHFCEIEVFGYDVCPENMYGMFCEHRCHCAGHESCSPLIGTCRRACSKGRYGPFCEKQCSSNCLNGNCDPHSGICYHCKNVRLGDYCGIGGSYALASTLKTEIGPSHLWAFIPVIIIIVATPVVVFFYMSWKKKQKSQANRANIATTQEKSQSNRADIETTEEKSQSNKGDTETTVPP